MLMPNHYTTHSSNHICKQKNLLFLISQYILWSIFIFLIWEEDVMLDNALENSHTTSSCVFEFCIIATVKYWKLSNKSKSIIVTLIKIQNIHWAHIFTCVPILPNRQPRFWCFYVRLHKFGIVLSRGKNSTLRTYHQILKVLL